MKQRKTLRQRLTFFLVLALVLPMVFFTVISQIRIWSVSNAYLDEILHNDTKAMNTALDMVLEKYAAVLYDFCTDEDVIRLVENIEGNHDELNINSSQLRRKLIHICNRNEGVEGITLVTASGQIFFYDRMMASSVASTWAGMVEVPALTQGERYQVPKTPKHTENGDLYLYQIARKLVDFRDIKRQVGTVILSINADTLNNVISDGENIEAFITSERQILASTNDRDQMKSVDGIKAGNRKINEVINDKSGWSIREYYSIDRYLEALYSQTFLWISAAVVVSLFLAGAIGYVTNPILNKVDDLVQAMNRVEGGDFLVQVSNEGRMPSEVHRIVDVFNGMVKQLNKLIVQVKQSAIDQKNAEISAMEAQIDPHFLYNTLDTINWKALERDEYEISSMVGALADILRYSIRNPGDTVSTGQVLYWIEQYTMLQSKKLEAPLELEIDVPDELKNYRLHKLLLQPFVENAIRHGFYQKKETCRLNVRIRQIEEQMHIIIKDNGRGISPEVLARLNNELADMSGHVGLSNVRKRLQLYYEDDATVYFESKEGCYTMVHLFVKIIYGEEKKGENSRSGG